MPSRNAKKSGNQKKKPCGASTGVMNDRLLDVANEIRDLWDDADVSDLLKRYRVAVKCREVRDNATYGTRAIAKLADHIGRKMATIYDYARVAEKWPDADEFTVIAETADQGRRLTWSHLVELAKEEDNDRRQQLMLQAREGAWTVVQLSEHRLSRPEEADDGSDVPGEDRPEQHQAVARCDAAEDAGEPDGNADPTNASPTGCLSAAIEKFIAAIGHAAARRDELGKAITDADPSELKEGLQKLQGVQNDVGDLSNDFEVCIVQAQERIKLEARKAKASAASRSGKKRNRKGRSS